MSEKEIKKTFILYGDYEEDFELLTDTQIVEIIKSIFAYVNRGEICTSQDQLIQVFFRRIKKDIDRNNEKWQETKQRRSLAGKKGAEVRKAKATEEN